MPDCGCRLRQRAAPHPVQNHRARGGGHDGLWQATAPGKLDLTSRAKGTGFYHLLRGWPVELDASRGACPARRRLVGVILIWWLPLYRRHRTE